MENTKKTKANKLELMYMDKQLDFFTFEDNATLMDLKTFIINKYSIPFRLINLSFNNKNISNDNSELTNFLISGQSKFGGEKLKVRIIPQIRLNQISQKFIFLPFDNPAEDVNNENEKENCFPLNFDLITNVSDFKQKVFDFFTTKMDEFHYKLDHKESEFYISMENEKPFFIGGGENANLSKYFFKLIHNNDSPIKFYFLIKNSSVLFYGKLTNPQVNPQIANETIELRKTVSEGQKYKVILQTYNSTVLELDVYPEMSVSELKEQIEKILGIRKNYQELLYLVYKLKDDEKKLKDYYIRPQGVIFLRGFYFPLIFTDYYNKNIRNIMGINIAEKVSKIKEEIVNRLKLEYADFKLMSNGKELDDDKFLIDYNIQRMQNIYIK